MHIFFISKIVGHHFWLKLMVGEEIEQGRKTKKNLPPPKLPLERKNQGPS
jgi:hypothetical protein